MTRFFHEAADRPEASIVLSFAHANDDRVFINATKKRRRIKRAIRNQLYGCALAFICTLFLSAIENVILVVQWPIIIMVDHHRVSARDATDWSQRRVA